MSYELKDKVIEDLLQIEVKDLKLPGVDIENETINMNFTCGSVKNSVPYTAKKSFTMKVVEGPKSNYLKVELSSGVLTSSKQLLATVRISVEELILKSASIDQ